MKLRRILSLIIILASITMLGGCGLLTKKAPVAQSLPGSAVGSPEASTAPSITLYPTATVPPTQAPTQTPSPTPSPTPVPTGEVITKEILSKMTLSEKIGQLFFVRLRKAHAIEDIRNYKLGGYILFGEDFKDETKSSILALTASYQSAAAIPMFIGVDEEGGTVNRISKYPAFRTTPFYSPMALYKEGGFDLVRSDTLEKATLLLSLGINVNLAPVCDVSVDPKDFIYPRTFGKSAEETSDYVKSVVEVMKRNKLGSTLKHFPGYGNNVDTHTGIAIDERDFNTFETSDFLPFEAGIEAGADSILVSHNVVTCIDKDHPASLSPKVHELLRNYLGFTGVIMTDDLSMDAIKEYTGDDEAAVQALLAGNDLLIATNFEQQILAVIAAVKDGTLEESRIDESVLRVLSWKYSLDILE